MSWFKSIFPDKIRTESDKADKKGVPDGVWGQCPSCNQTIYHPELVKNLYVCPACDHHIRIGARDRLGLILDEGSAVEIASDVMPKDSLKFKDTKPYVDRLKQAQKKSNETEAMIVQTGTIMQNPACVAVFEYSFVGGSMGSVVGERFVQGVEAALAQKMPFICVTASGGARMQESLFSLMQMTKVSAAIAKLKKASCPYIVVLTDPTSGGVSASLGMLGDIQMAEPGALICFAGPRVIAQTVRETLPEGFQRSEFLLEKGMIDMIVHRKDIKARLAQIIGHLAPCDAQ